MFIVQHRVSARLLCTEPADSGIQEYLTALLTKAGFDTATTQDGDEAIAMARKGLAGVVIVDLFMPKKAASNDYGLTASLSHHEDSRHQWRRSLSSG